MLVVGGFFEGGWCCAWALTHLRVSLLQGPAIVGIEASTVAHT